MRGEMLWFNERKDHGFILTEEGERLSVLGPGFAGGVRPVGRCAHAVVRFEISDDSGTRQATNVVFEPIVAPRRARSLGRRGSGP
jgi:cold shock CspA family protein